MTSVFSSSISSISEYSVSLPGSLPNWLTSKVVKGPYDPDVTPVTDNAILGFPAVPFALPIVTPAPAVSVLPNALPLFIATRPVIPVRSVIAFNADASAGTTFFSQTLSLTLQKISVAEANEIKLICYNRVQIFVQDNNDNVYLLGMNNGWDVTGGTIVTGAAKGDMSGFTLELEAQEKEPIFMIKKTNGSGTDYPFDQLGDADSELTIVSGTN